MSDRRFYVQQLPPVGSEFSLDATTARHLYVLRIKPGAMLVCFDATSRQTQVELRSLHENSALCRVLRDVGSASATARLVLVQCLPKGHKIELGVRMATELGVDAIHLAISERTIVRPEPHRSDTRHKRLVRIAQEAAQQAQRSKVVEVVPAVPLLEAAARAPAPARKIVFWESSDSSLDDAPAWDDVSEAWIIVGPEGGLSQHEVQELGRLGYAAHGLGQTVLRVETAVPVAIALVADRLGCWGNGPRGSLLKRNRQAC